MSFISNFFYKLTHTKALDEADGKLESAFFRKVYRVWYIAGFSSVDNSWPYQIYKTIVKILITLLFSGEVWFGITEASSLEEIAGSINITIIQTIALLRFLNRVHNADSYRKLTMSMESPYFDISTEDRKELFCYWAKKNDSYLKLLLILGNCTLACWFLYPLLDEFEYNMFIDIYTPFHYQSPWRYAISYTVLFIAFLYMSHFVITNDLIMQSHLLHLVCQFDVLSDCLKNMLKECAAQFQGEPLKSLLLNKEFQRVYKKRMGDMVEQHRSILRNVLHLRQTLSNPMLGQLLASGTLICFIGYQAATTLSEDLTEGVMHLLYLGYNLFVFYIICRWCEEITNQSLKISEAVYFSHWESGVIMNPGVRSSLMLIIARANKPVIFTAGGMYDLSLEAYSSLVKASYSALTVLLRFRQT